MRFEGSATGDYHEGAKKITIRALFSFVGRLDVGVPRVGVLADLCFFQ